jgi:GntR family transcriptional repressor for pyruvate dehydrogenase complex
MASTEGSMFERLHSQKNYMQIARQIRNLIRDGTLKVGDKLPPERTLVEQFGASRASIREALSALEMLGLIDCRGGQGNYIRADGSEGTIDGELLKTLLQDHDPFEIFEARLELEPNLAALTAERATDEEREKLKAIVERLKAIGVQIRTGGFKEADIEEYMEEDRKYHLEIGRCAHNNVLFTVFSGVNLMMQETHWKGMKSKGLADEANIRAYALEHDAILRAILGRNPKEAQREVKKHLVMLRKTLF